MGGLKGTKSHENLKAAFAGESQANRRYLYFARRADIEGYPEKHIGTALIKLTTQTPLSDIKLKQAVAGR